MKKSILTLIITFWICGLIIAQNQETAPKIISTIPAFGDCNVDPGLNEIIIKFDQDMANGMSVINTPNMPDKNGQAKWIDKKTFSIPVKLYPNRLYSLAFNNSKFQNFTNTSGIPLNPDDLLFKTKTVSFVSSNKKAFIELQEIFPKKYSYASNKGIDWVSLFDKNRSELENSETPIEFALKLIKILRVSDDPHLWIEVEGQKFQTGKLRIVENNYNSGKLFERLRKQKLNSKGFSNITGVVDSIGYIAIKDWNTDIDKISFKDWGNSKNPEIPADDVLMELFTYPNLIIDVRENSGGNESFAKKFAGYFFTDSVLYEKTRNYNEKSGKFDAERTKWVYPSNKNIKYLGNIYVLSGPTVMSSNESFILMMKQLKNAKIIGMKTYGSSGNPLPYELSNGVKIYIPSWQAYTLDGKLIEGNGINPDIEILTTKNDFQDKDVLFEKVVKMIEKKD